MPEVNATITKRMTTKDLILPMVCLESSNHAAAMEKSKAEGSVAATYPLYARTGSPSNTANIAKAIGAISQNTITEALSLSLAANADIPNEIAGKIERRNSTSAAKETNQGKPTALFLPFKTLSARIARTTSYEKRVATKLIL